MTFDSDQSAYKSLRDNIAERTSGPVIWIGAGPSRSAGVVGWKELVEKLRAELEKKIKSLDNKREEAEGFLARSKAIKDPWLQIQYLEDGLGRTSFQAIVREELGKSRYEETPRLYKAVWRLPVRRVLTTNLDGFAARSFNDQRPGQKLVPFAGLESSKYSHLLQTPDPIVVHLHGELENADSWVLTKRQLNRLLNDKGYKNLVRALLTTETVIFLGISAEDVAVGGHLDRMRQDGIALGTHYWITSRADGDTDKWAESCGIRVIRYRAGADGHNELDALVDDLLGYVSIDALADPVLSVPTGRPRRLGSPGELRGLSPEEVRVSLNQHAQGILDSVKDEGERLERYAAFVREYGEAIHNAWYVTAEPPENVVLGYEVVSREKKGAFGTVYRAVDSEGRSVALKVLNEEVRHDSEYLQCFRRGVKSMRILTDRGVKGMVPYRDASEIPACAVMKYVEGPNLEEAVDSQYVREWTSILKVAVQLATVIRSAHQLPERVLHRDIRPANVMLEGYYADQDDWSVVVLDFDLSWHKGAVGMSMDNPNSSSGYVAPEQVSRHTKHSTRSALVDSFGLGMTLFFLASGRHPVHLQHKHTDWREELTNRVGRKACAQWRSLPRRYCRLIEWATKQEQSERWDVAQILGELTRLHKAFHSGWPESAELAAEEVVSRSKMMDNYRWSRDQRVATTDLASGVSIAVQGREEHRDVLLTIEYIDSGMTGERRSIAKWLPKAFSQAAADLNAGGWRAVPGSVSGRAGTVQATADVPRGDSNIQRLADSLTKASDRLAFDG